MKQLLLFTILSVLLIRQANAQVGINSDNSEPDPSAMLDVKSSSRGLLQPRMTHAEINALPNPANGLVVYCTDCGTDGNGAFFGYINGVWNTIRTCLPPQTPSAGTNIGYGSEIIWNWTTFPGTTGTRWNNTNDFSTATDLGNSTTKSETGLTCNTAYTRFAWAYNACGISVPLTLTQNTSSVDPVAPVAGTDSAGPEQITWRWISVEGATGYKWSTANDTATMIDMGTATSYTETGLTCNTPYDRYAWAYNTCGMSAPVTLSDTTVIVIPDVPVASSIVAIDYGSVTWEWNLVEGATGYKWNVINDSATAIDVGTDTWYEESGLACGTMFTRYAWAYNSCSLSAPVTLNQRTFPCPPCGTDITIHHTVSGGVAPVDKTVTYGTVLNSASGSNKCWITRNLGAAQQATSDYDPTEAAGGWYWQFNRKQGYKVDDDGHTRTPSTAWDETHDNSSETWEPAKDPCTIELGACWRMPTKTEWDELNLHTDDLYQSDLKIHHASDIGANGEMGPRGNAADILYWSNEQHNSSLAWALRMGYHFNLSMDTIDKAVGATVRCICE